MLRYSIASSPYRLSSALRQRATAQLLAVPLATSRIPVHRRTFADSKIPPPTSATPASPSSQSSVPPENAPNASPTPQNQAQTSPRSSIEPPPKQPADNPGNVAAPPPRPRKSGRFRRFLLYLFLGSGLAYSGGVYLALKFDNFHDFFTEYVPYGEEVVLYFEERDFYRRFPNATRHHAPAKERQEAQRVTIPGKSGLSSRVAEEEETTGSDLTKKGPHNSATEPHSKSEKVVKMKEDRASRQQEKKEAPKPTPQEAPKQETPKEEPKQPASTPASALQLVDVKDEEDPVVQELARVFNDIVKVISADGTGDKHADGVAKARSEIESIGKKITALRADAQRQAEDEIKKAHEEFDKSAREMIRRIDEARAAEILQYQQEFETEHERLSRAYQEKLKVELEREKELAEQRLKNQLVEQAIELNRKFLLDVHDLVERERAGRLGKINELTANVQELEKLTSEWSEVIDSNLKTQQLQVAIDAVRTVLESADGPRPFVRELIAVKELAADNPVVSAAIASINPSAYQRGIPTNAQIIDRFRRVANEVRKASLLPEDAGIASHAASVVLNKVMFKKDVAADGDDVESILVRTENLLEEGNLDAAAREMNSLQGWAKILSKDWLADVRRVLEVKQAIEVIETEARLQCLRVQS